MRKMAINPFTYYNTRHHVIVNGCPIIIANDYWFSFSFFGLGKYWSASLRYCAYQSLPLSVIFFSLLKKPFTITWQHKILIAEVQNSYILALKSCLIKDLFTKNLICSNMTHFMNEMIIVPALQYTDIYTGCFR